MLRYNAAWYRVNAQYGADPIVCLVFVCVSKHLQSILVRSMSGLTHWQNGKECKRAIEIKAGSFVAPRLAPRLEMPRCGTCLIRQYIQGIEQRSARSYADKNVTRGKAQTDSNYDRILQAAVPVLQHRAVKLSTLTGSWIPRNLETNKYNRHSSSCVRIIRALPKLASSRGQRDNRRYSSQGNEFEAKMQRFHGKCCCLRLHLGHVCLPEARET